MLSKIGIQNLIKVFATKEDLKKFMTIAAFRETMFNYYKIDADSTT